MEDYWAAFLARALDTEALHKGERTVGTVHFGGFTIECLLKSIIVAQRGINEWAKLKKGGRVVPAGGTVNPKHELMEACKLVEELMNRLAQAPEIIECIEMLHKPIGSLEVTGDNMMFIDARYDGRDLSDEDYQKWYQAYRKVLEWLISQELHVS